jgi:hypothetical protein
MDKSHSDSAVVVGGVALIDGSSDFIEAGYDDVRSEFGIAYTDQGFNRSLILPDEYPPQLLAKVPPTTLGPLACPPHSIGASVGRW